ncbi:hypothetical protein JOF42_003487 [Microbacterium phyllosphaerae]|uniref:Uncharacterized protein n=1 Tax=Microbacterium phyllosphaerae TaxID=124798 RepID=A0ABS4WUV2_9MICO|nr:hypothetical protein [Microbacterium phyllosphaerae]MBP2379992.1 hypothetical protein [Microbacterium phyllosphaerae]
MSTGHALRILFESRGFEGVVTVDTATSENISQTGLGTLLTNVPHERLVGYPIMTASVEYTGPGYNAVFAWVQFVEMIPADGSRSTAFLDNMPSLNQQIPFSSFGFLPTLFDAPANPNAPDLQWRADSYLVRFSVHEPRVITPIAGFQWGYDLCEGKPAVVHATCLPRQDMLRWTNSLPGLLGGWDVTLAPDSD